MLLSDFHREKIEEIVDTHGREGGEGCIVHNILCNYVCIQKVLEGGKAK